MKGKLGLYLDEKGLIRCGGRFLQLQNNPKLLLKGSHFTKLVIVAAHRRNLHVGVSQTLDDIRNEYWIVQGRSSVRKVIRYCLICIHWEGGPFKTRAFSPFPDYVTTGNEPAFTYTGIDYLGPLLVKNDGNLIKKLGMPVYLSECTSSSSRGNPKHVYRKLSILSKAVYCETWDTKTCD